MTKRLVFGLLMGAMLFALLPVQANFLAADDAAWTSVKPSVITLSKDNPVSPAFKATSVGGDFISLPVGNPKGLPIMVNSQKIMVDKDLTGKFEFTAAQGEKSTPFQVTLVYPNGEKVRHWFVIFKDGSNWAMRRNSGVSFSFEGGKVAVLDDNNNGIYGEESEDGLYSNDSWGAPLGRLAMINGKIFEIQINDSATELKYRPYTGPLGSVDICKEWTGKSVPKSVIVKGSTGAGTAYFDVAGKAPVSIPVGSYTLVRAYFDDVEIFPANTSFSTSEGNVATMKWGMKLELRASVNVDSAGKKFSILPMPQVFGCSGEQYKGAFMEGARFQYTVTCCTANGQPVGKTINWTISSGSGGG
ncbi:MAG: hypothetical protein WC712_12550 [Candidatus Brocadiia bacterium]